MKKLLIEFIGTMFLVLTIGLNVIGDVPHGAIVAPIAIGVVLAIMIYAGGHISGAHYNPAVSLGAWMRGALPTMDLPKYWVAQVLGGWAGACTAVWLKGNPAITPGTFATGPALVAEFLFTFALVFVVLNVATAKATAGNSYFGWAIGLTVLVGAYSVGSISGGAFNPAVAIALCGVKVLSWSSLWIYLVADLLGGAVAALIFKVTCSDKAA